MENEYGFEVETITRIKKPDIGFDDKKVTGS
jgi:hypothetical protein